MQLPPELEKAVQAGAREPRSGPDWLLETVAVLAVVLPVLYLAASWPDLPERVPTHFGPSGAPDGFGPRAGLWAMAAVEVGLYALFAALPAMPLRFWNVPVTVTERNAKAVGRYLPRFGRAMKAAMSLLLGLLLIGTVRVALGQADGLPPWFLVVALAAPGGTLAWSFWKMARLGTRGSRA